jgi:hypothetical protein
MNKHIILGLVAGSMLSLAMWAGCDNKKTNPGTQTGPDMGGASSCVKNPASDKDFLNSCAPPEVVSVPLDPFYPDKAPGGTLPSLP